MITCRDITITHLGTGEMVLRIRDALDGSRVGDAVGVLIEDETDALRDALEIGEILHVEVSIPEVVQQFIHGRQNEITRRIDEDDSIERAYQWAALLRGLAARLEGACSHR